MIKSMLVALAIMTSVAPASNPANEYPETFVVTEVNQNENYILLETFSGNVFKWNDSEDWMTGDIASAIMDSNGTEEVQDDVIVKLQYSGYME